MMRKRANNSGMTVMEAVLVIALLGLMVSVAAVTLRPVLDSWALGQARSEVTGEVHYSLSRMATEIAAVKDNANVLTASATDFSFTDAGDNTIRFYLSGSDLMRNGDILARGIQALSFSYLDQNDAALATPQVAPSTTDIWRIRIRLTAQRGDQRVTMESQVRPRNFRRS